MAGRCICASVPATGAAMTASGCLTVSGAGTPASPFTIGIGPTCLPLKTCASTTRPSSPTQGQTIYETDTGIMRVWNGLRWQIWSVPPADYDQEIDGAAGSTSTDNTHYVTVATGTITNPWSADDPFRADLGATLMVGGAADDLWDLIFKVAGVEVAFDRFALRGAGTAYGTGKIPNVSITSPGAAVAVEMGLRAAVSASPVNFSVYDSPAVVNQIRAFIIPWT